MLEAVIEHGTVVCW